MKSGEHKLRNAILTLVFPSSKSMQPVSGDLLMFFPFLLQLWKMRSAASRSGGGNKAKTLHRALFGGGGSLRVAVVGSRTGTHAPSERAREREKSIWMAAALSRSRHEYKCDI